MVRKQKQLIIHLLKVMKKFHFYFMILPFKLIDLARILVYNNKIVLIFYI